MNSKVKVVANEAGAVINLSANPEFGYVRVEQIKNVFDENGFMKRAKLSALIHATVVDLNEAGYFGGQELPGKIVVIESLESFNKKNPSKSVKEAGDTGVVCTYGGMPVHRKTIYTENAAAQDIYVKHDNIEEIKEAYARLEATKKAEKQAMQPNGEFEL
jgi:hypothetical protein